MRETSSMLKINKDEDEDENVLLVQSFSWRDMTLIDFINALPK